MNGVLGRPRSGPIGSRDVVGIRGPVIALLFIAIAMLGACTGGESDSRGASATSTVPSSSVAAGGGGPVEPPITFGVGDPSAAQVLEGLRDRLAMSDAERACAEDRLSSDADLLGRVGAGVSPNTADFAALQEIMSSCKQSVTFADRFAANVLEAHPGATPEQQRCVADGFAGLSPSQLNQALSAGLNPPGSDLLPPPGAEVLDRIVRDCGLS